MWNSTVHCDVFIMFKTLYIPYLASLHTPLSTIKVKWVYQSSLPHISLSMAVIEKNLQTLLMRPSVVKPLTEGFLHSKYHLPLTENLYISRCTFPAWNETFWIGKRAFDHKKLDFSLGPLTCLIIIVECKSSLLRTWAVVCILLTPHRMVSEC